MLFGTSDIIFDADERMEMRFCSSNDPTGFKRATGRQRNQINNLVCFVPLCDLGPGTGNLNNSFISCDLCCGPT